MSKATAEAMRQLLMQQLIAAGATTESLEAEIAAIVEATDSPPDPLPPDPLPDPPPDPDPLPEPGDYKIPLGVSVFDASKVPPGSTIAIMAGKRGRLKIKGVNGIGARINIRNYGDRVDFFSETRNESAITFVNCSHFNLLGNGSERPHGIRIGGTNKGNGILMRGACTDYTFGQLEVTGVTGRAAMKLNASANCNNLDWGLEWAIRNIELYSIYSHHNGGEGAYIGSSYSWPKDFVCDGEFVKRIDPLIDGLIVRNSVFERNDLDGLQIQGAHDVQVYGNTISRYGLKNVSSHREGLRFGRNCDDVEAWENLIEYGTGHAFFWNHLKGTLYFHDNAMRRAGYTGPDKKVRDSSSVWVFSNTGSTWRGRVDETAAANVLIEDNGFVESAGKAVKWAGNAGDDNQIIHNTVVKDGPEMADDDSAMIEMKGDGPLIFEGNKWQRTE